MLKILRKISSLLLKKYALNLQKNAEISVIMPTLKNRAETKIFQCQNRKDFAFDEPFALRFASGTILQIVMEKIFYNGLKKGNKMPNKNIKKVAFGVTETILQIVMEKIRKICQKMGENTLKIRNYLQKNETILNGGCHA